MTIKTGLTRVNVRSVANSKAVRREVRNGREVAIVPSATLPDNVVMNEIRYPADEIEQGYATLEGTPAPLGHPSLPDGGWLSASEPEGINRGWIGAWNENVRRENGRVYLDKVIDVEVANRSEGGRAVMAAIEAGDPIHTSTGVYTKLVEATNDSEAKQIATSLVFDHDAILLSEEGAATPEQGVGLMVNRAAPTIPVINSRVDWAEDDLAWAAEHLLDSAERLDKAKAREALLPRLVEALRGIMSGGSAEANEEVQEENVMDDATKAALDAVNTKIDTLGDTLTNGLKAITDAAEEQANAAKAAEEAERETLTNTIVKAAILDEDDCKALPVANLRKLAANAKPGKAASVGNGAGDPDLGNTVKFRVPGAAKEA